MSNLRNENIARLRNETFDVLIIGAGINGAVASAALSGYGARVALIDKEDFAGETSSNSSNLAWGGIKYLENYEFLLVNKLCLSRNRLMRSYPSTVKEIRFLTTIQRGFRLPVFMVYLGTLLYWVIGRCKTTMPRYFSAQKIKQREAIINVTHAQAGFEYSDCYLYDNDARFVFNFVRKGLDQGCAAANYIEVLNAERRDERWLVTVKDGESGEEFTLRTKVLINACGPYVDSFNQTIQQPTDYCHVFSKGVHLIVDKLGHNDKVLTFFASDGRLFFVIPMGRKTCIGTTDTRTNDPHTGVSDEDRQFILRNANSVLTLTTPLTEQDIIAERCGVRPLAIKRGNDSGEWLQLSRKHVIECDATSGVISVFGGKLTDCVNVGEELCHVVRRLGVPLTPGKVVWHGESGITERNRFLEFAKNSKLDDLTPAFSSEPLSQRLWRRYDKQAFDIAEDILTNPKQAQPLIENTEYLRAELKYTAQHEMVTKLEDFVRRRSKIAMVLRYEDIVKANGLLEACEILFGNDAQNKLNEYKQAHESTNKTH